MIHKNCENKNSRVPEVTAEQRRAVRGVRKEAGGDILSESPTEQLAEQAPRNEGLSNAQPDGRLAGGIRLFAPACRTPTRHRGKAWAKEKGAGRVKGKHPFIYLLEMEAVATERSTFCSGLHIAAVGGRDTAGSQAKRASLCRASRKGAAAAATAVAGSPEQKVQVKKESLQKTTSINKHIPIYISIYVYNINEAILYVYTAPHSTRIHVYMHI